MNAKNLLGAAAVAVLVLASGQALAAGNNNGPPSGPVILNLDGTPVPHGFQQYSVNFNATSALTDLSFAFREDPAFLSLDDVVLTHGGVGPNLLTNGDFELGPNGANAPSGWSYLNTFGAAAAGVVSASGARSGNFGYFDGAVQAYDAITQQIGTVSGDTYDLTFWLSDNGPLNTFSALSTNGNTTGTGGNGINLVVYGGDGIPVRNDGVPEPAAWALMLLGFGGIGATLRSRRRQAACA